VRRNRRFNRLEYEGRHFYNQERGKFQPGSIKAPGLLKCRLAHGLGYSIVIPDLIFLGQDAKRWIQPFGFFPNVIDFWPDDAECHIPIDVSSGHVLRVSFATRGHLGRLDDGSDLYRCEILGPTVLSELATGCSRWNGRSAPEIEPFHHTTEASKQAILQSKEFWLSHWNIQGTRKKLVNVGYVYFTALDRIVCDEDLTQIAMAHNGRLTLVLDGVNPPATEDPEWRARFADKILDLEVYRASTADRTATLRFWISSQWLAPQHVMKHWPPNKPAFYEIPNAFTHRVGLIPGHTLKLKNEHELEKPLNLKQFPYVVVGHCNTLEGLAAPFDEEDTKYILKFDRPRQGEEILGAWKRMANQERYSGLSPELAFFTT
jgi:hypothetical protein